MGCKKSKCDCKNKFDEYPLVKHNFPRSFKINTKKFKYSYDVITHKEVYQGEVPYYCFRLQTLLITHTYH